jgi:hypothetical protein
MKAIFVSLLIFLFSTSFTLAQQNLIPLGGDQVQTQFTCNYESAITLLETHKQKGFMGTRGILTYLLESKGCQFYTSAITVQVLSDTGKVYRNLLFDEAEDGNGYYDVYLIQVGLDSYILHYHNKGY